MSKKIVKLLTDKLLDEIDKGVIPWQKPWFTHNRPVNAFSKRGYTGMNVWLLQYAQGKAGYAVNKWMTRKQINQLGGMITKGESYTMVMFYRILTKEQETEDGEKYIKKIPLLRFYRVWNVAQTEGLDDVYLTPDEEKEGSAEEIKDAEEIIASMPLLPPITHDGRDRAYYVPVSDSVHIPEMEYFKTTEGYYSTLFHEIAHSTGHKSRLNRPELMSWSGFGSHAYSKEELVAEITACALVHESNLEPNFKNSASYIEGWSTKLRDNPNWLITATSHADKAYHYVLGKENNNAETI